MVACFMWLLTSSRIATAEYKRWERHLANQMRGQRNPGGRKFSRPPGLCHSPSTRVRPLAPSTRTSEVKLQAKLHLPSRICGAGDGPEFITITDVYVGNIP